MPLDSPFIAGLCDELKGKVIGTKIDRINMPEKDMLVLSLHSNHGNLRLLISLRPGSARVHITSQAYDNPDRPPMFCMLLRKHISGGRIISVRQPNFERMLEIGIDAIDELNVHAMRTLVIELMGKGLNLLLLDENRRIIDCLRRVDFETSPRALLPGLFYEFPPVQDKPFIFDVSAEEVSALVSGYEQLEDADRWLMKTYRGLSPFLARELSVDGWSGVPHNLEKFISQMNAHHFQPTAIYADDMPLEYSFFPSRQYGEKAENRIFDSFGALLDAFFADKDFRENLRRKGNELHHTVKSGIDKQQRKLSARLQDLKATEKREEYKKRGDLITANIYRLKKGMDSFEAEDFYSEGCPKILIPLDVLKNPQQNAAQQYKLYTKAVKADKMLRKLIDETEESLEYLLSVQDELDRAETLRDLTDIRQELTQSGFLKVKKSDGKRQKLPSPRKPMRFISSSGREILVGRGNVQNDELTFKLARRTDLWFHVLKMPGSHVILSQREGPADEVSIAEAASLAVTFSCAKEGGKSAVDYTEVRFVKKPAGALPGKVIYSGQTTLIVNADSSLASRLRKD